MLNGLLSYAVFRDQGAHIRLEEPEKIETEVGTTGSPAQAAAKPAVALGLCLREITLGPDSRAREKSGGGRPGGRWFGHKFRKMETAILGNYCECANLFLGGTIEARSVNNPTIRGGVGLSPFARVWLSAVTSPRVVCREFGDILGAHEDMRCEGVSYVIF